MIALASQSVIRELMIDVARQHAEPEAYVARLYDRAIAHLDPHPSRPERMAHAQARDLLGAYFSRRHSCTSG